MAKVFVSFLGTGSPAKNPGYDKAAYNWPEKSATTVSVCFAQTAILKILEEKVGEDGAVDKIVFLCTKESEEKHLDALRQELRKHLVTFPEVLVPKPLVSKDMTSANQWEWFEQLLNIIDPNDTLVIDFTHGMRAVPIVFSSAIGFLQRAKGVTLAHALYAWYDVEEKDKVHPIVDMRDFYVINDWAEGVARLADDADARKLGELARHTEVEALKPMADDRLINAFAEMTDCIRNVDVNNVGKKVSTALKRVEQARTGAESGSARVMLDLVWDKFNRLATDYPPTGRYDRAYFTSQLEIINVLMEHRLFMQAFTAMREFVGSVGMVGLSGEHDIKKMTNKVGRNYRKRFAEAFVGMITNPREKWDVPPPEESSGDKPDPIIDRLTMKPWFDTLEEVGIMTDGVKKAVYEMTQIRNGFDHAWTSKTEVKKDVETKGREYQALLESIVTQLAELRLIA